MRSSKNLILFLIFLSHFCFSENVDTLKYPNKKGTTAIFNSKQFGSSDSINYVDNSIDNFQSYLSRNFFGNSGLPNNDFFHLNQSNDLDFNYSRNNFGKYYYTKDNLLFYDTHSPYTDLFYLIGSKREQDFKMTFSNNVKKNWNITANFFRIRSDGFYVRQNTNNNFISLSSNFKSKTNRYNLLFGVVFNNVQCAENGGISNDSVFENGSNQNKGLLDVNLSAAKSVHLNRSVFVNQYLNFGKQNCDSSSNSLIIPNSHIEWSTTFEDNIFKYIDENPLTEFYSTIYYDSVKTLDSTYNLKFENELLWRRVDNFKRRGLIDKFGVSISVKDQFVKVNQYSTDTTFNNIIFGTELYNTYSDHNLWYSVSGKYCFKGYNAEDYLFIGSIKKGVFDNLFLLTLDVSSKLQTPDFIYQSYSSNHFKWSNNFEKIEEKNVGISFLLEKYKTKLGVNYIEYDNPVYFDNYAIAKQYLGNIGLLHAYLKKDFSFFNWHFNNSIQYQYVPDSVVIRLPQFILEHSLFYENDLFKKAMRVQIGASVFFVSSYYADSYMPATSQFYLQNDKKYGNYPLIDFFINAKIKAVRVFFKIDHLNSGFMGNKYMLTPDYPMNDRAFKLGISWRFYD